MKWFMGSTRFELSPDERSVWIDVLAAASLNEPPGQIDYFSFEQLSSQFNIELELLERALEKFESYKKIKHNRKKRRIKIINWKKYQSEYQRQLPYRQQVSKKSRLANMEVENSNKVTGRLEGEERRLEVEEKQRIEEIATSNNSPTIFLTSSPLPSISKSLNERKTIKEEFLALLKELRCYPFSESEDSLLFDITVKEHPKINILEQTNKKITWWKDHPDALKANPRNQLLDWFKEEAKFIKRRGPQKIGDIMPEIDNPDHRNWLRQLIEAPPKKRIR